MNFNADFTTQLLHAVGQLGLGDVIFSFTIQMIVDILEHGVELQEVKNGKAPTKIVEGFSDWKSLSNKLNV